MLKNIYFALCLAFTSSALWTDNIKASDQREKITHSLFPIFLPNEILRIICYYAGYRLEKECKIPLIKELHPGNKYCSSNLTWYKSFIDDSGIHHPETVVIEQWYASRPLKREAWLTPLGECHSILHYSITPTTALGRDRGLTDQSVGSYPSARARQQEQNNRIADHLLTSGGIDVSPLSPESDFALTPGKLNFI